MRTFNDFEAIRQELAERLAAKDAEAKETGDHSPNVIRMSGMINMQQIRTASEQLEDRENRRKAETGGKLIRLSSISSRDQERRDLFATMFADDLGLEDYDEPEGYGEAHPGEEELMDDTPEGGDADLFEDLLSQLSEEEEVAPPKAKLPPLSEDLDDSFSDEDDYTDEIDRILQRARGGIR